MLSKIECYVIFYVRQTTSIYSMIIKTMSDSKETYIYRNNTKIVNKSYYILKSAFIGNFAKIFSAGDYYFAM